MPPRFDPHATWPLMRRLWREQVLHHKGRVVLVLALSGAMAGATALYPLVLQYAGNLYSKQDVPLAYQIPILVILVTLLKAVTRYFQATQSQQLVLLVICDLQERMFRHLTNTDLARVEREAPAQLATRFTSDATAIGNALGRVVSGVADVVTVVGLVASMIYMDWLLSLISAVLYPIAAVPIQKIGKRVRKASGGMQETMGETAAILNESFAQARVVRAYRLEEIETHRADGAFRSLYRTLLSITRSRSRVDPVLEVLGGVAVAGVIAFEAWRASVSAHTLGDFGAFVGALLLAARPLRALGSLEHGVAGGAGRPVARLRGDRRAAARRRAARRQAAAAGPWPCGVRHGRLRLPGRPRRAGWAELRGAAGSDGGAGRTLGRRQVDGSGADPAAA